MNGTHYSQIYTKVAPLAGAWIEIVKSDEISIAFLVAPLAGAWIEIIYRYNSCHLKSTSLPLRERGLKFYPENIHLAFLRRSPCGSVD